MSLDVWNEQLRRGALEFAVLLTLSPGARYGLEIIRHLESFTDLVITEGTIYPLLARLTRDGVLHAEWSATRPCIRASIPFDRPRPPTTARHISTGRTSQTRSIG